MIRLVGLLLALAAAVPAAAAEQLNAADLVVEAQIERRGDFIGYGFDSIWMMSGRKLVRVDVRDNSAIDIAIPGAKGSYRGMAVGEGGAWVPDTGTGIISKIDPGTNAITVTIPIPMYGSEGSIGLGEGSVWVTTIADKKPWLFRFDAATGAEQARIELHVADAVTVAFGSAWVVSTLRNEVYRVDAATNALVATIPAPGGPLFITSGSGSIWVVALSAGVVHRIDPETNTLVATIETGGHSGGDIFSGGGFVWATYFGSMPLVQINPETNEARVYAGRGFGDALTFGAGSVWISGRNIFRITPPPWS